MWIFSRLTTVFNKWNRPPYIVSASIYFKIFWNIFDTMIMNWDICELYFLCIHNLSIYCAHSSGPYFLKIIYRIWWVIDFVRKSIESKTVLPEVWIYPYKYRFLTHTELTYGISKNWPPKTIDSFLKSFISFFIIR